MKRDWKLLLLVAIVVELFMVSVQLSRVWALLIEIRDAAVTP